MNAESLRLRVAKPVAVNLPSLGHTQPMDNKHIKFVREFSKHELIELSKSCFPHLKTLSSKYAPEIDLQTGFPADPNFLDLIRGEWLSDTSIERSPHEFVVSGLGYALGLLLETIGYKWCWADCNGQLVSMWKQQKSGNHIFVPPFSFVDKRQDLQNVEVFNDLLRDLKKVEGS
jgi:hypothetical protein